MTKETTAETLTAELAEVREAETRADREYRAAKRELRQRRERIERQIARARATAGHAARELTARTQAGTRNIERMLGAFEQLGGRASAAAATAAAGSKPGHQVWAIRALEEDGMLRETGEKDGRSKVYELTRKGKGEAVRVTRRKPGS